jgi:hypothetical protein
MFTVHVHDDLDPASDRSLDDEQLAESRARVRFLMLQRMELIWQQVEEHLDPQAGPDPRWAEIGVRLLDRYSRLYGLDKPKPAVTEEDDLAAGLDRRAMVLLQLEEIRRARGGDLSAS